MARIPIACTLTATEMPERLREWQDLRDRALLSTADIAGGVRMRLRLDAAGDVRRLVAAEAQCCAFLTFRLDDREPAGVLVLDIVAPQGAETIARALAGR